MLFYYFGALMLVTDGESKATMRACVEVSSMRAKRQYTVGAERHRAWSLWKAVEDSLIFQSEME